MTIPRILAKLLVPAVVVAGAVALGPQPEAPAQAAPAAVAPSMAQEPPPGWKFEMEMFSIGKDMDGNGYDNLLTVWSDGAACWHYADAKTRIGKCELTIYESWQGSRIYGPGDVNLTGTNDIVRITPEGDLWLYEGDGKGKGLVGDGKKIGWGWSGYRLIPAGDLNGDGKVDLLGIKNADGTLYFYAGDGKGGFPAKKKVGWGWSGFDLYAAGDINQDGKPDILGVRKADGVLFRYLGAAGGAFPGKAQSGYGWTGWKLASGGDLNKDGKADLVGMDPAGKVYFYPGDGKGGFGKIDTGERWVY